MPLAFCLKPITFVPQQTEKRYILIKYYIHKKYFSYIKISEFTLKNERISPSIYYHPCL
ncbi:hypothetical protein MICAE_540013 [Microcystis aeruginosa PCC 9806]|uniref:Uncharacterized protein n=1 Tax=Microcystis aeruginosa PCC 9806 TaxID=1160282 RepID=I4GZT2_MICAE|nr:hypothetical protein MICAE_540013 [Microcystis aeruginosa PCC 9806]